MITIDDNGKIMLLPEAMEYPEIVALRDYDTTLDKSYFHDALKYTYHTYKPGHSLDVYPPAERMVKVCSTYFNDRQPADFEQNDLVVSIIKRFIKESMSKYELVLFSIRNDLDEFCNYIRNIPLFKDGEIDAEVIYPIMIDGKMEQKKFQVKASVKIDNSVEKFAAIKKLDELLTMMDKQDAKIKVERKEQRKSSGRRLFDERL